MQPPVDVATNDSRRSSIATLALLAALTVAVFLPTLRNQFLPFGFDDALITDTAAIRELKRANVVALATDFNHAHYVPLTMLSFAVDYHFWGLNPVGYHVTNVLLHAVAVLLLYRFLWPIVPARRVALLAAAVFAVHPLQMEAVSVAVQRKTLLAGVLWFLTLILYQRWRKTNARRWYGACVLAFVAAALSKPAVASLPVFLLLYDYTFSGGVRLRPALPFFAIALFAADMARRAHQAVGALHPLHGGNPLAHILMVSRVALEYVDAALLPIGLSPLYYYPPSAIYEPINFLALTLILVVSVYLTMYRHHYRWSFFCLSWFVLALLPESNLLPLTQLRADRFLYLALPAFALWVALGWERLARAAVRTRWRIPVHPLAPFAVGALAITCYWSAAVWHDDVSAWSRVVQRHPWCAVAHQMLGRAYWRIGDAVNAERELQLALPSSDQLSDTYLYLAQLYANQGAPALALTYLQRFLQRAPGDPRALELQAALMAPSGS
jgi:tetratricopeptide (TPR) repeat protein